MLNAFNICNQLLSYDINTVIFPIPFLYKHNNITGIFINYTIFLQYVKTLIC